MQLREWQQQLQQHILHGGDAATLELRQGSITREQQLAIYLHAYSLRLTEALRCNYPALHQLLGDDDFDAMAQWYIAQHPSRTASIRWFGDAVADFLLHHDPYAQCPAMADLARFEWALRHTVDAADAEHIRFESMQQIAPETWGALTFDLHPSLGVLQLDWNAPAIWKALTNDQDPPQPENTALTWLIYRDNDLITQWRSADADEAAALAIFRDGGDFDAVCEFAAQQQGIDAAAMTAASWLKRWIGESLLVARKTEF